MASENILLGPENTPELVYLCLGIKLNQCSCYFDISSYTFLAKWKPWPNSSHENRLCQSFQ